MRSKIIATFLIFLFTSPALGQPTASFLGQTFSSLGSAEILNVVMFGEDYTKTKLVVLFTQDSKQKIDLFSLADGKAQIIYHLDKMPRFMAGIHPDTLRVSMTDDGPIIMLSGCAAHDCGRGVGEAGALAYVVNEQRLYTARAIYDPSTKTSEYTYEPKEATPLFEAQKKLLDSMLREQGYDP